MTSDYADESGDNAAARPLVSRPSATPERDTEQPATGESATARELLARLGYRLARGAVFWVEDRRIQPQSDSQKGHPYVLLGPMPPPTDPPEVAVRRPVSVAYRRSWKPDRDGPPPATPQEEQRLLRERRSVFSARGTLDRCERDGVFYIPDRRWVPVGHLVGAPFLGWLPRPALDWLLTHAIGATVPDPYPPE